MKIVIAHESVGTEGGVETYRMAVIGGLRDRGHQVALLYHRVVIQPAHPLERAPGSAWRARHGRRLRRAIMGAGRGLFALMGRSRRSSPAGELAVVLCTDTSGRASAAERCMRFRPLRSAGER